MLPRPQKRFSALDEDDGGAGGICVCGPTETAAVAEFVESVLSVALTVTVSGDTTEGAIKTPLLETAPAVALQVTDVICALSLKAANFKVLPAVTLALGGEIVIAELEGTAGCEEFCALPLLIPEHPEFRTARIPMKAVKPILRIPCPSLFAAKYVRGELPLMNTECSC